ncbi:exported hypothetical protein [Capnocytophaga canimorsus]|uniref:Uncharacterized protein n=1 Tax=Capnocytophaga canimorsus TaxID=28188 RepID=A0A0B7I3E3_9FLAO|nr:hypothetical protein [Capnocytophaga canimorsus]CEN46481.1 exported hypothetical protein [Capnocytophaga canimorsus]
MNLKLKRILIVIGIAILSYSMGCFFPINALAPNYSEDEFLTKSEYYGLVISVISAVITFCAVIVALFKDDLREYWKKPKIKISMPDKNTIEEFNKDSESSSSSNTALIASKYISKVEIENIGNLATLNTEIILESLRFCEKESSIWQEIECFGKPLEWNGMETTNVTLPVGAKKVLNIVSITAPEQISKPDSSTEKSPSRIIIGGVENNKEYKKGKWEAKFQIYAQNHKPTPFTIEMEWNGIWKTRLTEFNSQYKITLKQ